MALEIETKRSDVAVVNHASKSQIDGRPGVREPWFWIIISPLLLVLVACTITISIAVINADDVVVGNYYKQGLAVNEGFSLANNGRNLGLFGTMYFDKKDLSVLVELSSSKNQYSSTASRQLVFPRFLNLALSHPAKKNRDKTVELNLQPSGMYLGFVDEALVDRWYWKLNPPQNIQEQWQLSGELSFASDANKTTLSF